MARPRDEERYQQLKRSIADIGLIRRGSLVRRFMPCGTAGCRCQNDPPELHGPYYQWSHKVRGKTVTVRLTPEQAALMQEWIANGRELKKIVAELEKVAYRITERELREARR